MILRARHRMRKLVETELLQTGKEARQLLPPKGAKHHLGRTRRAGPRRQHQDQAGEIGMIDVFDRAIGGSVRRRARS
jgi:hypothetical protein